MRRLTTKSTDRRQAGDLGYKKRVSGFEVNHSCQYCISVRSRGTCRIGCSKVRNEMGFQENQILCDSRTVIQKCQSTTRDYSIIGAIIRDIHSKKSCFQKIEFKYIQRTGNRRAHNIASESLKKGENTYLESEELIRRTGGEVEQRVMNPD